MAALGISSLKLPWLLGPPHPKLSRGGILSLLFILFSIFYLITFKENTDGTLASERTQMEVTERLDLPGNPCLLQG